MPLIQDRSPRSTIRYCCAGLRPDLWFIVLHLRGSTTGIIPCRRKLSSTIPGYRLSGLRDQLCPGYLSENVRKLCLYCLFLMAVCIYLSPSHAVSAQSVFTHVPYHPDTKLDHIRSAKSFPISQCWNKGQIRVGFRRWNWVGSLRLMKVGLWRFYEIGQHGGFSFFPDWHKQKGWHSFSKVMALFIVVNRSEAWLFCGKARYTSSITKGLYFRNKQWEKLPAVTYSLSKTNSSWQRVKIRTIENTCCWTVSDIRVSRL